MTTEIKQEMIKMVIEILENAITVSEVDTKTADDNAPIELLTIHECSQVVNGLSEHTVRQLVKQGKIPSIRTGAGKNGKILVPKTALLNYLNGTS